MDNLEEKIVEIVNEMSEYLAVAQLKKLQEVILRVFTEKEADRQQTDNSEYLRLWLDAKKIEGCSEKTLDFYGRTVRDMFMYITTSARKITTEDLRSYLSWYQKRNGCTNASLDNIRRNLSSFFNWLAEENHILKSPMTRIHPLKTDKPVKLVIDDEDIEKLRAACPSPRDLAMIDLLYSTGMRIGELVKLNRADIDFISRECVVYGKGGKERRVYLDAKAKLHLQAYLDSRGDDNPALFVSQRSPWVRLQAGGCECRIRWLGKRAGVHRIHPHMFRRSMATRAIDKGMPIEQVQQVLGHSQIGTTMHYALVSQHNVKISHQKFIG